MKFILASLFLTLVASTAKASDENVYMFGCGRISQDKPVVSKKDKLFKANFVFHISSMFTWDTRKDIADIKESHEDGRIKRPAFLYFQDKASSKKTIKNLQDVPVYSDVWTAQDFVCQVVKMSGEEYDKVLSQGDINCESAALIVEQNNRPLDNQYLILLGHPGSIEQSVNEMIEKAKNDYPTFFQ